jgi:hypothetical protein
MGPCSIHNFTVNSVWNKAICLIPYIASGNSKATGEGIGGWFANAGS